ncbi:MAG TPA: GNAT family N-acetyltransferase, partial [Woeseiaceae bacterium]|nr:GNAT family N-acetyltransferase [Woeseiaceae bacterium]
MDHFECDDAQEFDAHRLRDGRWQRGRLQVVVRVGHRNMTGIVGAERGDTAYGEGSRDGSLGLAWRSYRGRAGLEAIAEQWDQLDRTNPDFRFFQGADWHRAYLEILERHPEKFWFAVAYRANVPVGIFPLRTWVRDVSGIKVRALGLPSHSHVTLADFEFTIASENATLVSSLTQWLHRQREFAWDVLMLDKVPANSAIGFAMAADPPPMTVTTEHGFSAFLDVDASFEQATESVSSSFRRNLRRLARRAEESAPLRFETCATPEALEAAFPSFLAVEGSGWKGAEGAGTAIALDANLVAFYRRLMRDYATQGRCVINLLRHGQTVVAAQFCLISGKTFNILKIGYSEEHGAFAPGNLLMERTIRQACESPELRVLSFVTHPRWSHLWKPKLEPVHTYAVFNR